MQGIFVGIPHQDWVLPEIFSRLAAWAPDFQIEASFVNKRPHHRARNALHKAFLESNRSHMLWLDSDILPPANALEILLGDDVPIVAGLVHIWENGQRRPMALSKVGDVYQPGYGAALQPRDMTTLACCLVQREVMEKMPHGVFQWEDLDEWRTEGWNEDQRFFRQAVSMGYQPHVDFRVVCAHKTLVDLV